MYKIEVETKINIKILDCFAKIFKPLKKSHNSNKIYMLFHINNQFNYYKNYVLDIQVYNMYFYSCCYHIHWSVFRGASVPSFSGWQIIQLIGMVNLNRSLVYHYCVHFFFLLYSVFTPQQYAHLMEIILIIHSRCIMMTTCWKKEFDNNYKNYLRLTISQERCSALALLIIESYLTNNTNFEKKNKLILSSPYQKEIVK